VLPTEWTNGNGGMNGSVMSKIPATSNSHNVRIYYCSTGTTVATLAKKLHQRVQEQFHITCAIEPLNALLIPSLPPNITLLLLISTTGDGDIPANGTLFSSQLATLCKQHATHDNELGYINVAIFGVGVSGYVATFNGAAKTVERFWADVGARFVKGGVMMADASVEAMPLSAFNRYVR
jgi:hypothetical protein